MFALAVAVPAVALASTPARPPAGKWKTNLTGDPTGGFTVSKDRKSISGIHFNLSPSVVSSNSLSPACQVGQISVPGRHKLRLASHLGTSNWIVGKRIQTSGYPIPVKVTVREAGKSVTGTFYQIFDTGQAHANGYNDGHLKFGSCLVAFSSTK